MRPFPVFLAASLLLALLIGLGAPAGFASDDAPPALAEIRPLIERYCHECHAGDAAEADVDLAAFASLDDLRRRPALWQRVAEVVAGGEMPPREADQPAAEERQRVLDWVRRFLAAEAAAHAGDPGRVVLRRLSNAEYTHTVRDLTGIDSLDPAREFPVDGAAGEGFTNTGQALVMSPALVTKYLDAAKGIAAHAVLLPDGLRFSPSAESGDQIDECLSRLRTFFQRYTVARSDIPLETAHTHGVPVDPGHEGFVAIDRYLAATLAARRPLRDGDTTIEAVAREHGLSPKYLALLWNALDATDTKAAPSLLLDRVRTRWEAAGPEDADDIAAEIGRWQSGLWKFNTAALIGRQNGRVDGPPSWLEPVSPLLAEKEYRIPLRNDDGVDVRIHMAVGDAGDGPHQDVVVWRNPRVVVDGAPDVPLADAVRIAAGRARAVDLVGRQTAACLAAIDECRRPAATTEAAASRAGARWRELAAGHGVDPMLLAGWASVLGLDAAATDGGELLAGAADVVEGRPGLVGWTGAKPLSVIVNTTGESMRIPGTVAPRSVAVHPASDRQVVVGWRSPEAGSYDATATIGVAQSGCGNGVAWALQLRRGSMRQTLADGTLSPYQPAGSPTQSSRASLPGLALHEGDMLCLVVEARDGDHACDLTAVSIDITSGERTWSLAKDVVGGPAGGNPHADAFGTEDVWSFASEPVGASADRTIPAGSLLARWQLEADADKRRGLAEELQSLLAAPAPPRKSRDGVLHRRLLSITSPLLAVGASAADEGPVVLPFGVPVGGLPVDPGDLCMLPGDAIDFMLPADPVARLVVTAVIHPQAGREATAQSLLTTGSAIDAGLSPALPFLARKGTIGWRRLERSFTDWWELLPPAVCYGRIVPVDEVVSLNIFYREDDRLKRLMLDEAEAAELDRLWDELIFVSDEPLKLVDVFEQVLEYMTQDRVGIYKEVLPMRGPLTARAEAFTSRKEAVEPTQMDAVIAFAARAFRRPLTDAETRALRTLHTALRGDGLPHDEALRLVLARVLVSPQFLYKIETPGPGVEPRPVGDFELASRLSYFLWSSLPDAELLREAAANRLHEPDVLLAQTRRMVADPRIRRLATEFGTHWLHVENFDEHDEKSPEAFPGFAAIRGAMHEEAVLVLTDLFRNDRPIRSLIDGDATFLNEPLAEFYGIPGVRGHEWRRVEDVRRHGRGGVLGLAATLAKQSGASRTSPILRGTWFTEVLLGQKVPKPPKGVPPLAEAPPAGLSERELTAMHSRDAACAGCHARFDAYGFALEEFDAIGRRRAVDVTGRPIDAAATLPDGTMVAGHADLCEYLATAKGDEFVRQFCRKLLGYALGRQTQLSDMPLLDAIQAALEARGGRVSTVVEAIVTSPQFRDIRGADAAGDD